MLVGSTYSPYGPARIIGCGERVEAPNWAGYVSENHTRQPPAGHMRTARKPAECIGEPRGQTGQVIEGEQMAIVGRDHQFAFLARQRSDCRHIGIYQRPNEL